MRRVRISAEASADLDAIWLYIAKDSPANADRFLDRILDVAQTTLRAHPHAGRPRDELAPGLRSFVVGRYLLFYAVTSRGIDIVRVIHGARDLGAIFGPE